jgi:hypothetical protein
MIGAGKQRGIASIPGFALPAVGSLAVAPVLTGTPRPWRVLGVTAHARWCASNDDVLLIADDRAVRLPNAVIAFGGVGKAIGSVSAGEEIVVGGDVVMSGTARWRIVRWWDPQVVPIEADRADVARRIRRAARTLPTGGDGGFGAALGAGDATKVLGRASTLIGRGRGLTPEGDDVLVGAIAGFRHVATSTGDAAGATILNETRNLLLAAARSSTTLLSFALLRHAFAGEVAGPVAGLLRALTGRGELDAAVAATVAIGHSSGPALASGVVSGAAAACGVRL